MASSSPLLAGRLSPAGADARPAVPLRLRRNGGTRGRSAMHEEHVYKVIELVGSSETSIEDAIQTAVSRAGRSVRNLRWFEVMQTRGHVEGGQVRHYQVTLKVGFTLDDEGGDD
jgi:flavin-binding protein dodecin